MMKKNYPINREFLPLSLYTPTISKESIARTNKLYRVPKAIFKDPSVSISTFAIPGYNGGEIEMMIITPVGIDHPAPCFFNIHGGGFVFEGTSAHYRHAVNYAKGARCVVAYVKYRLAPGFPFPYPQEDCYAALVWLHEHADEIGIDPDRIGIGGDSAGGTLAVTSCLMARDRETGIKPLFLLLIFPFLDARSQSESFRTYTDKPVWNSTLSKQVTPLINPRPEDTPLAYRSPAEAELDGLPPAYIEVAEFDALRDDGVQCADLLKEKGIAVEFHDTKGTMHGFDYMLKAPTTRNMEALRIRYMSNMFKGKGQ